MTIRPLFDNVLVKRRDAAETTKSGLFLAPAAKEKPSEADVIAVGPGSRADDGTLIPPSVKAGDCVLFGKFTGNDVRIADVDYLLLRESDILAVLDE